MATAIVVTAEKKNIPVSLVLATMGQESGGDHLAVSNKGARGLMQLMPGTAKGLGVNIHDPVENVMGGITYLSRQVHSFGQSLGLGAYNAGPGAAARLGHRLYSGRTGVHDYDTQTTHYVRNINAAQSRLSKVYD